SNHVLLYLCLFVSKAFFHRLLLQILFLPIAFLVSCLLIALLQLGEQQLHSVLSQIFHPLIPSDLLVLQSYLIYLLLAFLFLLSNKFLIYLAALMLSFIESIVPLLPGSAPLIS